MWTVSSYWSNDSTKNRNVGGIFWVEEVQSINKSCSTVYSLWCLNRKTLLSHKQMFFYCSIQEVFHLAYVGHHHMSNVQLSLPHKTTLHIINFLKEQRLLQNLVYPQQWQTTRVINWINRHKNKHKNNSKRQQPSHILQSIQQHIQWDINPNIVMCIWMTMGFWITGFIVHLWFVTTSNYNSLTELHFPNIGATIAHLKSSQFSLIVFW
jgi:hypothetical protein